jgi:glucose-1-phosphate adenylyltransferase
VNSFAWVEESILFEGVDIGRHARVRRAIIDKGVRVPSGMSIGFNPEEDAARGLTVSPQGVTVVPKGHALAADPHAVSVG